MKRTTISLNVYEVGDVIKINRNITNLMSKQRQIDKATRAVVISVAQRVDKLFTYKIMCANGSVVNLKPDEQGKEEYVGHIDLGMLFEGDSDD